MADPKREELKVQQRSAILVAVADPANPLDKDHILDELKGLVKTASVRVVDTMVQYREQPHPGTCLGSGKLEELERLIAYHNADIVVFDNNLSPSQGKNIEEAVNTVVVDRSEVILDIFATSARTAEAKLQVELAQLLYFRTRLKRMWTHLERIEGGIGTGRGPGEKQIETDRRLIDRRIAELKKRLATVEKRRERTVSTRSDQPTVSLVGYTNAGKSTLMNALSGADVYIADKLFATLETRTRRWSIPNCGEVLLSDTVGFVRNLPHHLVASFKSTLEEARRADLLLHVVDASNPEAVQQIETVYQVLEEIEVDTENLLLVFNKVDNIEDHSLLDVLRRKYPGAIEVSAVTGAGLETLTEKVAEQLADGFINAEIETHAGNGRLLSFLAAHSEVLNTEYHESRVTLHCRLPKQHLYKVTNSDDTTMRYAGDKENGAVTNKQPQHE